MSEEHVLVKIEHILRELLCEVRGIRRAVAPQNFSVQLNLYQGDSMSSPITSLPLGGSAQLVAQLLENNAPYVAPAGAPPYTFSPSATSDDPNVSIVTATADLTGGLVPLAQQFLVTDSTSDTVGVPDDITVTATAPDGSTVTETVAFSIGPASPVNTFGLSLAFYPAPGAAAAAKRK